MPCPRLMLRAIVLSRQDEGRGSRKESAASVQVCQPLLVGIVQMLL